MRNLLSEIFSQALSKPILDKCRFTAKEEWDRPKLRNSPKAKKERRKRIQASKRGNR